MAQMPTGGMQVLTASVFSVRNKTKSSCGSKVKSRGVGSVGGAWTWHCAALQPPGGSCARVYRGGPVMLSCLGVGGVGREVDVAQVGVLVRKVLCRERGAFPQETKSIALREP